jgi:hypothetical protein
MRLFYKRSKEALVTLSDAARHRPSICYRESRNGPVRITHSDIITSAMHRICLAALWSIGIPSMRDGFSSQPHSVFRSRSVTVFSGWSVGRLAELDVTATFHGPFTLASKLTSIELVEGLSMWRTGGRERNIYHLSSFQKIYRVCHTYTRILTNMTCNMLDLLHRT